ncbi:hypothetical protein OE88DRAFT_1159321 [Heliocybe sulcata]|uniref:Uncharacterized protein n=1 Tax=Heliocybe sulcata TaxID=5364 RepID=A0A5C3NA17_9AGAM|nr:hypothetical protein OE88DRAFT_1159321 [Heliocybe sulcata]
MMLSHHRLLAISCLLASLTPVLAVPSPSHHAVEFHAKHRYPTRQVNGLPEPNVTGSLLSAPGKSDVTSNLPPSPVKLDSEPSATPTLPPPPVQSGMVVSDISFNMSSSIGDLADNHTKIAANLCVILGVNYTDPAANFTQVVTNQTQAPEHIGRSVFLRLLCKCITSQNGTMPDTCNPVGDVPEDIPPLLYNADIGGRPNRHPNQGGNDGTTSGQGTQAGSGTSGGSTKGAPSHGAGPDDGNRGGSIQPGAPYSNGPHIGANGGSHPPPGNNGKPGARPESQAQPVDSSKGDTRTEGQAQPTNASNGNSQPQPQPQTNQNASGNADGSSSPSGTSQTQPSASSQPQTQPQANQNTKGNADGSSTPSGNTQAQSSTSPQPQPQAAVASKPNDQSPSNQNGANASSNTSNTNGQSGAASSSSPSSGSGNGGSTVTSGSNNGNGSGSGSGNDNGPAPAFALPIKLPKVPGAPATPLSGDGNGVNVPNPADALPANVNGQPPNGGTPSKICARASVDANACADADASV